MRPGFTDIDHMNEVIVERWNEVVKDGDYVYHMGDVVMSGGSEFYPLWSRLKGSKRLIVGNHDDPKQLIGCFKKIMVWRTFKEFNFTCTHIPIHPGSFRGGSFNLHGHVHSNDVRDSKGNLDLRYINNCVEKTDYRPRHLDEILQIIKDRS